VQTLWQDLLFGLRMMGKRPGFTLVAALTLALGIGANTAIFSVVNAVLLNPFPYREPDKIVRLFVTSVNDNDPGIKSVSYPDFLDYRAQNQVFTQTAVIDATSLTLMGSEEPERIQCALVSASLFPLLGIQPVLGRAFLPEEDQPQGAPVVILGYGLWQRRFGSSASIIGQNITLTGNRYTVIGVLPAEFKMPSQLMGVGRPYDVWMPVGPSARQRSRGQHRFEAYARLKSGVTLARAQDDLSLIASRLAAQYPDSNKDKGLGLVPLRELAVRDSRTVLFILLGAVSFVLLIACANVANLLLARAAARQKEIAIRMAMGAGRARIIRQMLTESVLLAVLGGGAGLLLALWGADAFAALHPGGLPRLDEVGIDGRVLGFTFGISLLTGLVFGLAPALQASKSDLLVTIKEGSGQIASSAGSRRIRGLLVISEVALSLVLLIGAGLLINSFWRLQQVNPGIQPDHLLTLRLTLPQNDYRDNQQASHFYQQLLARFGAMPGVESAGAVTILPLGGGFSCDSFTRDDRPAPPGQEPCAEYRSVTPGYFKTMGIALVHGREFTERDLRAAPPVAVINETMARRFFADVNPIGMRITPDTGERISREIVGVVRDVKHFGLDKEAGAELYVPYFQDAWARSMTIVLRTSGDPASLSSAARREVWALDKNLPVANIQTMEQLLARSIAEPRFRTLLLGLFASVALLLAASGIYGVMSYAVTQRTPEIGIRMALGASTADVLKLVVGHGMILTLIGVTLGLGAAFTLTRWLKSLLFGISATDPLTFTVIALLMMAVALVACWIPARRATRVDPMVALRYE
jgi:putative ABC transport system permease protein